MAVRKLLAGLLLAAAVAFTFGSVAAAQEGGGEATEEEHKFADHASEECAEILETGGTPDDCQEAPSPIAPAKNELIWGIISFTVLFVLLWKLAWPGIKKGMEDRTERIRSSLEEAEHAKAEAERVLDDYRSQLSDPRREAGQVIEEARQQADALRRDLQTRAENDISELRERAAADVEAAKAAAIADLRDQVAQIAIGAAELVVQRSLDRDTQMQLIENYINQVTAGSGN